MRPQRMRAFCIVFLCAVGCYRSHPPPGAADGGPEPRVDEGDAGCAPEPDAPSHPRQLGPPLGPLPVEGCRPGSLAGLDPSGEWWIFLLPAGETVTDPQDSRYDGARPLAGLEVVRFEPGCRPPSARVPLTEEASDPVFFDEDDLFLVVHEGSGEAVLDFALDVCERVDLGGGERLWGHWSACFAHGCLGGTAALERIEPLDGEGEAEGLVLVSEWTSPDPRPTLDLDVQGGLAALARGSDGVRLVDVSDETRPLEVGHILRDDPSALVRAELVGRADGASFAFVETQGDGVRIVDVTDPGSPLDLGALGDRAAAVATGTVEGLPRAFVLDPGTLEITMWDLEDPAAPVLLATSDGAFCAPLRLSFSGGVLAAGCGPAGFLLTRVRVDSFGSTSYREEPMTVVRAGDETGAMLLGANPAWGGGVWVIRERGGGTDEIARWATRRSVGARDLVVDGARVVVASLQDGVRIVDVTDPLEPREVAHYQTWDPRSGRPSLYEGARAVRVDPARRLVFVADWARGLIVLRALD